LANLARGRLRDKLPQLEEALCGVMSPTQRRLLREQLHKVGELDESIARLDAKIAELSLPLPYPPRIFFRGSMSGHLFFPDTSVFRLLPLAQAEQQLGQVGQVDPAVAVVVEVAQVAGLALALT